jgi:hypothetical protein
MLSTQEKLIFDPISESTLNSPLEVVGQNIDEAHGVYLVEHDYPPPERKSIFAGGPGTEGEPRVAPGEAGNRQIPLKLWVAEKQGVEAQKTNLTPNPSFEPNLTGWATSQTATLNDFSRSSVWRKIGEYAAHCRWTGTAGSQFGYLTTPTGTAGIPVSASTSYRLAVRVNVLSKPAQGQMLYIFWYTAAGAFLSASQIGQVSATGETILNGTGTAPGTAAFAALAFGSVSGGTPDIDNGEVSEFYIDGVVFGVASAIAVADYFDGDTPGALWNGTAHASSSTIRASGAGKRFTKALNDLEQKIEKLHAEGGTYARYLPSGDRIVFDVIEASLSGRADRPFNQHRQEVDIVLTCKPYGREAEVSLPLRTKGATLPVLQQVETGLRGSAPGLARLEVIDNAAVDRWTVGAALQSHLYDSSADAALFYEAESRTPLNGASAVAGPASIGISGAGSNVVRQATLGGSWAAVLSTQASGGGAHHRHVGRYRVWAVLHRPAANTGEVSVALEWGHGDLRRFRRNEPVVYAVGDREGVRTIADLGIVAIPQVPKGTQRWEGRIIAKSTVATDDLDVDCYWLQPLDEGAGIAKAALPGATPTAFSARDEFDQAAGALTGKVAPVGGTWAVVTGSDADDFSVTGSGGQARRTAVSDGALPRMCYPNGITPGAVAVAADVRMSVVPSAVPGDPDEMGIFARSSSAAVTTNLRFYLEGEAVYPYLRPIVVLASGGSVVFTSIADVKSLAPGEWYRLALVVDAGGRWAAYVDGALVLAGQDPLLAAAGSMATGRVGLHDRAVAAQAVTREYDNFAVWTPAADAGLFASQSCEFRHDGVYREDSAGAIYSKVSEYRGDLLRTPPARREKRSLRYLVWGLDHDPDTMGETALRDIQAQLHYTPRYDVVPDPA